MENHDPKEGGSKDTDSEKPTNVEQNMTLRDYLALPENTDANIVQPLTWCPHLQLLASKSIPSRIHVQKEGCEECGHVGENWICLICLSVHCSRYVNEHMLIHGTENSHPLTLSFSDISVWCYKCNDYVDNPKLYKFQNDIHKSKFGEEMLMPQNQVNTEFQLQME